MPWRRVGRDTLRRTAISRSGSSGSPGPQRALENQVLDVAGGASAALLPLMLSLGMRPSLPETHEFNALVVRAD